MKIGVTGATGQLGTLTINAIRARSTDAHIVALVRAPSKAEGLADEVRKADYKNPADWTDAAKDLDVLVLISSNDFDDRAGQHRAVIDAAAKAGVGRIVYTSILKGTESPMLMAEDHKKTEADLKASGVPFTILRNGWYTENYTDALPSAVEQGAVIGSAGQGKLATATRADYAEAIAAVALSSGHDNKTHELAGDEAYTLADLAAEAARVTGKDIGFKNLAKDEYAGILQQVGMPEGFAIAIADSDDHASRGALFDDSRTLSALIGRPTTPMKDTVAGTLG